MARKQAAAHAVIGPVKMLDEKLFDIAGLATRVTVMELEPRCPAPIRERAHKKHVSVEIESAGGRLQVALAKPPELQAKGTCLSLGKLDLEFGKDWSFVTVAGHRYDLARTGPRMSYEFAEDGRLTGLLV